MLSPLSRPRRTPCPRCRFLSLSQLTATKAGRHTVREKGTYLILRELHRWEREPAVLAACEKLIQVGKRIPGGWWMGLQGAELLRGLCPASAPLLGSLQRALGGLPPACPPSLSFPPPSWEKVLIGDEPGPGMENLLEVNIPEEVEQQLQRLDQEEEEEQERWRREQEEQDLTPRSEEPLQ